SARFFSLKGGAGISVMRFCSSNVRASSALMSSRALATLGFARIAWENISTADVVICARALLTSESTSRRAMELDKMAADRVMATPTRPSKRIGPLAPRRRFVEPRWFVVRADAVPAEWSRQHAMLGLAGWGGRRRVRSRIYGCMRSEHRSILRNARG